MYLIIMFFFFNDTATTEIYTLSLHDALPISAKAVQELYPAYRKIIDISKSCRGVDVLPARLVRVRASAAREEISLTRRSEEHTSELQSRQYLVCRLLLEKKKKTTVQVIPSAS